MLVLSEFTGAVEELPEALPCNPFDLEGLAGTISLALELDEDDRRSRLARMAADDPRPRRLRLARPGAGKPSSARA